VNFFAVAQAKVTHILRPGKASEKTPKEVIPPSLCEISQNAPVKKKYYSVSEKSFPVFEGSYKENPLDYRNGTGAKFNVWSPRYFEKVDLLNLLLTCDRSSKKPYFQGFLRLRGQYLKIQERSYFCSDTFLNKTWETED
jgi:hypothetical protein